MLSPSDGKVVFVMKTFRSAKPDQRVMKLDQAGVKWPGKMCLDPMYLCLGVNGKTEVLVLRKYP